MAVGLAGLIGSHAISGAVLIQYGGSYGNWPTAWQTIPGYTDPVDSGVLGRLDFVGSTLNPGGYWATDQNYVYFRARVNIATIAGGTYSDCITVLVDNTGDYKPDYGFSWDSYSNDASAHGLELQVPATIGATWGRTKMDDKDGDNNKKGAQDFNNNGRTGDGYVRTVDGDGQPGSTSFIDFAVSWSFLQGASPAGATSLAPGQTWHVQFASLYNKNDHNDFNADIGFGQTLEGVPGSDGSMSEGITVVPEPQTAGLILGLAAVGGAMWLRRASRNGRRRGCVSYGSDRA